MRWKERSFGCERVRSLVSLHLDGELSPLEERELTRHLTICDGCRAYAADLRGVSELLREAPPVAVDFPIDLPRRRRLGVANLQAVAAVAGVSVLAAVFALGPSRSQNAASFRGERSSARPAYLDSQTYEQRLLRAARVSHDQQPASGGTKTIPL